jgi:peptide/nickel transport system substrate-binding protein
VNRHSRTLLVVLVVAAVIIPYWYMSRRAPVPTGSNVGSATHSGSTGSVTERGGEIVASTRSDPRSFNRLMQPDVITDMISMLTLGRLVRINRATTELEPWLAERWTSSPDGLTHTLTLRDGVTWSDGVPFTSADVLFSVAAVYDPRAQSPLAASLSIGGKPLKVTAPDARTVVLTFPQTFGPGLRVLDNLAMMPRHRLEAALAAGTFAKAWTPDTPPGEMVAIGPFVLTEYVPAQRMVFDRNPRYWRRDARNIQLPYADRLTLEIVPDQDAEVLRVQAGQSDFMQQALRAADLEAMRPLEAQKKIQIVELGVSGDPDALVFNLRPGKWSADSRGAWIGRKEFRQAISHAVDREAFANAVFLGAAVPIHGPVTPGNPRWFWPSITRYEFSREKAKALLAGIGLENRDQDEWLEDAKGTEARFTLQTFRGNRVLERSAAVVRDELRQIGVAIDVVPLETNAVRQSVVKGDFEAAFIAFFTNDPDPAMSKDLWLSSGGAHFWHLGQTEPATDWERQIDELMAKQASTLDEAERKRLFIEVQRIFAENLPMLHFAAPRVYIGASARLLNLTPALTRPHIMWSADTLAIANAARSQ